MPEPRVQFTISFTEPHAHYVDVEMDVTDFDEKMLDISMPVWTPGSYLIREYERHVELVEAFSETDRIACEKISKNTWRIQAPANKTKISYRVYGFEVSVRTNMILADRAFINPAATFMYIKGRIDIDCTVKINLPEKWSHISTGLPRIAQNRHVFYAKNFDILYDSPLELGNQDIWHFHAAGVAHEFAMVGGGNYDKKQLSSDITKIVEEETKIWGENPNTQYVFITHNYQTGGGGLEHLNSTVLGASRNAYQIPSAYKNFLCLVAHEYFHLWNVKRLRPKELGPFDYDKENYTTGLWIMEGFTSYYDNLIIRRCGFFSIPEYLDMLVNDFNQVYNRPGYRIQSAALASYDAWIKHYRPDENSANTSISYYNKGAMLAVALDVHILSETQGTKRLDNVLRTAYQTFYKKENRGFEEKEFQTLAEAVTGTNLSEIFDAAHRTEELDYNKYFNRVGYQLVDLNHNKQELSLGIKIAIQEGRIILKNVERGSGAWDAGLNVDDELIAINGNRLDATGKELEFILQHGQVDEIIDILVSRDGLIRTIHAPLRRSTKQQWVIQQKPDATPFQKRMGEIWLSAEI